MRVFIGIEFDHKVKEYLHSIQQIIKPGTIKGEFTYIENFHLTTKYIGHVSEEELDYLEDIIDEVGNEMNSFDIKINGIGSFEKRHSTILWVGILSGKKELKHLFNKIEHKCVEEGFDKEERKYRPHITIAKKVVFSNYSHTEYIPPYEEIIDVKGITLFHSDRVDGVLTYTPIYYKELKRA